MMLSSFRMFARQIASDAMLAMCFVAPALAGAAFRFGVPALDGLLARYAGRPVLADYWLLFDLFLATLTPFLLCFASAMMILEERDEGVGAYLLVTPVGKRGYVISRLILPAIMSSVAGMVVLLAFGLSDMGFMRVAALSPAMGAIALIIALFVTSVSSNRIEGMALGKLSGLAMFGIAVPFFIHGGSRFAFSFLPTFWVAEAFVHGPLPAIPVFFGSSAVWIAFLYSRFGRMTLRSAA